MNYNYGDTTFMILATAMVCLMTPGLAFFYGGLARKQSVLYTMMQSFISMGIITVIWIFGGFGLAFGKDMGGSIGNISDFFGLMHVGFVSSNVHAASIPFILFFAYQLMFCVITVPLMTGAFVERLNLKAYIWLLIVWTLLIYIPVCHSVWGGGFLEKLGFVDFAGGTVIHTTAGFGALAAILFLGRRHQKDISMKPNNLMLVAIGTALLWFGWFGFNSGGAYKAGALAATAFANTFIGLASGMITWLIYAKLVRGKIDLLDVLIGSVAGLATITPVAGYIEPSKAVIVGIAAGIICNLAVAFQEKCGWDDELGVWGVHGIGGLTGTVLIGFLANKEVNGVSASVHQLLIQIGGVLLVAIYSFVITFAILKVLGRITNIKPSDEQIKKGLDKTLLGQTTAL